MAIHSIFGSSPPSGGVVTNNSDTGSVNLATAFHLLSGVSGWAVTGVKFWLPSDSNSQLTGHKAYLWAGSNMNTATLVATADFGTVAKGAWNEVSFSAPEEMDIDTTYWASVYFPNGCYPSKANTFDTTVTSPTTNVLNGAAYNVVTPGNGAFAYGAPGTRTTDGSGNHGWYGVDVLVSDTGGGGRQVVDHVGVTDSVSAVRSGLPTTVHFSGSATDSVGSATSATATVNVGSGTSIHTVKYTMQDNSIIFGSALNPGEFRGPVPTTGGAQEIGTTFWVDRDCRCTGVKIWKHPDAAGSIPVTLWTKDGLTLATTTVTWTADAGGHRTITFPSPVNLSTTQEYRVSYFAANGMHGRNDWFFNAQDTIDPPFTVIAVGNGVVGGSCVGGSTHSFPATYHHANFYVNPTVEWDTDLPKAAPGYMQQWPNYQPSATFPMAVFYADPPWFEDYCSIGVTTFVGIPIAVAGYREAILASGADVWASAGEQGEGAQYVLSDPELAAHVHGYFLADEPDLAVTYRKPQYIRDTITNLRKIDSTRPTMLNFGFAVARFNGWASLQIGQSINDAAKEWLEHIEMPDVTSLDYYNLMPSNLQGYSGVWTYPKFITRLNTLTSEKKPIWGYVETATQSDIPGNPEPWQVKAATWAQIIAGAQGIVFFDHRFPGTFVTLDFAALLHDAPMRAAVQELCTTVHGMGAALLGGEKGYLTAATSSNTTAGPMGGTYGVPIHARTVSDSTYRYLLVQAIRPGTTTGTFTVPSAAGKTLTVLNESRTITPNGSGVFTDTFTTDYQFHLYRWVP